MQMRLAAWSFVPGVLALFCCAIAPLLPDEHVWGHAAQAVLYSLPDWLLGTWPLWALVVGVRTRSWAWPLVGALAGLCLCGWPQPGELFPGTPGWRVVAANVDSYSPDVDPVEMQEALEALDPDVVLIFEKRGDSIPGLVRVADNFEDDLPRLSHSTSLYCRPDLDCAGAVTPEFGSDTFEMPLGLLRLPDGLCVMGIHGPPPVPFDASGLLPYVRRVADHLSDGRMSRDWAPCLAGDPVLIIGDLNSVPGGRAHRVLLAAGFTDALAGWGHWAASWPAGGGWPDFPFFQLDQVLGGAVTVYGVRQFEVPGADHHGLLVHVGP